MTPLLLIVAATIVTVLVMLTIQTNPLPAGTVDPFTSAARPRDPASDTVANDAMTRTALPARRSGTEWNVRTLSDLSEVECLLDRLEACGVVDSEVNTIGEEGFAVRWR